MEKAGRKRLLTLPRSQRNNPPTHLVVSREGDAIRGQLLSMDVDNITLQVRGEERKIQMKSVAEIIWLQDAPEIVPPGKKPEVVPPAEVKVDAEKKNETRDQHGHAGLRMIGRDRGVVPRSSTGEQDGQAAAEWPIQIAVRIRSLIRSYQGPVP